MRGLPIGTNTHPATGGHDQRRCPTATTRRRQPSDRLGELGGEHLEDLCPVDPEVVGVLRAGEHRPTVQSIFRVAREAAVVDPELSTLVDGWLEEAIADITGPQLDGPPRQPRDRSISPQ